MQQLLNGSAFAVGATGNAAGNRPKSVVVKVTNPTPFPRDEETVEVNLQTVAADLQLDPATGKFAVKNSRTAKILDSQVYASEPGLAPDKLLFQVDLAPGETRTFEILDASALAAVPPPMVKTFARYVPERFDDFAWESDRIAHRTYGLALIPAEGTISSGPDVWIKKNRGLIVDVMYATKHYHEDNGEFMDDYRVGKSRGCGGMGIWDGKKLYTSSNYRNWKLITTGPIRSEFELTYDAWDAGNGRKVSETKRYSIDAGSWFTKAQSTFASDDKSPLTIGVGLAERACPTNREEFFAHDQDEGWLAYWQPEDKPKGIIGDAIILAERQREGIHERRSGYARCKSSRRSAAADARRLSADPQSARHHASRSRQAVDLLFRRVLGSQRRFHEPRPVGGLCETLRRAPRPAAAGDGRELIWSETACPRWNSSFDLFARQAQMQPERQLSRYACRSLTAAARDLFRLRDDLHRLRRERGDFCPTLFPRRVCVRPSTNRQWPRLAAPRGNSAMSPR